MQKFRKTLSRLAVVGTGLVLTAPVHAQTAVDLSEVADGAETNIAAAIPLALPIVATLVGLTLGIKVLKRLFAKG